MALVLLRAPLSDLAGGREHALGGDTVLDVLLALEHTCPPVSGWILDERRAVRTHVNIYVNGEPAESGTTVADTDRVYILPAITGGS